MKKKGLSFEDFIKSRLLEKIEVYRSSLVMGDGRGNCKLFTHKDRKELREFLKSHLN